MLGAGNQPPEGGKRMARVNVGDLVPDVAVQLEDGPVSLRQERR